MNPGQGKQIGVEGRHPGIALRRTIPHSLGQVYSLVHGLRVEVDGGPGPWSLTSALSEGQGGQLVHGAREVRG